MVERLTRHGNSLALVIDRPIPELLGIDADTPLENSTDGQVPLVSAVRNVEHRQKIEKVLEKVDRLG